jgi:cell division protein FtsW
MTVILFLALIFFGLKMMTHVKGRMPALVGAAAVFTLGFQALLNMGVVLGLLPTKGLNLPFISYGGSSLVSNFFAVGLILCAYNHQKRQEEKAQEVEDRLYANPYRSSETQRGQDLFSHL